MGQLTPTSGSEQDLVSGTKWEPRHLTLAAEIDTEWDSPFSSQRDKWDNSPRLQ